MVNNVLTSIFSFEDRLSLKEICAPGSLPGVSLMLHVLFNLSLHCLTRYDLGIPSMTMLISCRKASPTANLSIRNNNDSTLHLSSSDMFSYCLHQFFLVDCWEADVSDVI